MIFPDYFIKSPNFRTINGIDGKLVEYFHKNAHIKDIHLNIDQTFFLHVLQGTVILQSKNGIEYINAGTSVIIKTGIYIMSETLSSNKNFKAYLFFLSKDVLEDFRLQNIKNKHNTINVDDHLVVLNNSNFIKVFAQSISLLFDENYNNTQINNLFDIKSKELLHYLLMGNQAESIRVLLFNSNNDDEFIIKKAINSNYLNNLNIKQYAFLCNMSISSFKRKFQKIYHKTPAKHIKEMRLHYAKSLMDTKLVKVNELAYVCGFENPTTFSKLFKEKYGMFPKDYILNK